MQTTEHPTRVQLTGREAYEAAMRDHTADVYRLRWLGTPEPIDRGEASWLASHGHYDVLLVEVSTCS